MELVCSLLWIGLLVSSRQYSASARGSSMNTFRTPAHLTSSSSMVATSTRRSLSTGSDMNQIEQCSNGGLVLLQTLGRGAALRVVSDLTLGTPLENVKCRVAKTEYSPLEAYDSIISQQPGGFGNLWAGTPSRSVEGALMGALFLIGSSLAKRQVLALGGSPTMAALAGGLVGGLAQAIVMTPAGMVFTSLNLNRDKKGYENDNAITVSKRIFEEKGLSGMYYGGGPMCVRQATNWMSRSYFTEVARTTFGMSQYGLLGEIGSGIIGGVGSCWNTPVETIRVFMQADVSGGGKTKTAPQYWHEIVEEQGYSGLYRGVIPRGLQATWQTVFMVVVPNVLGI